ncbi:uncharacterized protein NPIL_113571 [Nephila pilipes]|uniref:Uncharacterized protein n=1 Tax=Nephila pilipes TaxID=299642 RepID=A0A8X6UNC9_NEPPI|nr:uncharacterized protein NPIL_113571 [Nephila pilipes]
MKFEDNDISSSTESVSITNDLIKHKISMKHHCLVLDLHSFHQYIPNFLYRILCWIGLFKEAKDILRSRITSNVFKLILIFVNVDNWSIILNGIDPTHMVLSLTHISTYALASGAWYAMYSKRRRFSKLMIKFQKLPLTINEKKSFFLIIMISCIPIVLPMITIVANYENFNLFTYGYEINNPWVAFLVVGIKFFLYTFVFPTLTNVIALLYCIMCRHTSKFINHLSLDIARCSPRNFIISKQIQKIKEMTHVEEILEAMQDIFSVPTFLIIISNLSTCANMLSMYLTETNNNALSYIEWTLYTLNCLACVITIVLFAEGVTTEECRFKDAFHKKSKLRMLLIAGPEEPRLGRWLLDKPDFVFTGWNILPYKRDTVFVVVGTLISYTALMANK